MSSKFMSHSSTSGSGMDQTADSGSGMDMVPGSGSRMDILACSGSILVSGLDFGSVAGMGYVSRQPSLGRHALIIVVDDVDQI